MTNYEKMETFVRKSILLGCLCLASIAFAEHTEISKEVLKEIFQQRADFVIETAKYPLVINAVKMQNAENLSLEEIKKRDEIWINTDEFNSFKQSLQNSPVGQYLKSKLLRNRGIYNEIILADNQGANVTAYPVSSDYWQGDEEKFEKAFDSKAVYIGNVEFDKSTQLYAAQISAPVFDENQQVIGVLIMGVKLSYAEAKAIQKMKANL